MSEVTLKFYIGEGGSGQGGQASDETQPTSQQTKDDAKTAFKVNVALNTAKRLALQVSNGLINNVGLRTGNYVLQNQLQTGTQMVGKVVSTAVAFIANPVLGAVAVAGDLISAGFDVYNRNLEIEWTNRSAEQLRRRAGYLSDGNRR